MQTEKLAKKNILERKKIYFNNMPWKKSSQ